MSAKLELARVSWSTVYHSISSDHCGKYDTFLLQQNALDRSQSALPMNRVSPPISGGGTEERSLMKRSTDRATDRKMPRPPDQTTQLL